jgi:hypothetical protein
LRIAFFKVIKENGFADKQQRQPKHKFNISKNGIIIMDYKEDLSVWTQKGATLIARTGSLDTFLT